MSLLLFYMMFGSNLEIEISFQRKREKNSIAGDLWVFAFFAGMAQHIQGALLQYNFGMSVKCIEDTKKGWDDFFIPQGGIKVFCF